MTTLPQPHLDAPPDSWAALPPAILARLGAENIHTPDDWRRAGRRRRLIFGITARVAARLDALARRECVA